jgi:CRP-like cAMP-binding protein
MQQANGSILEFFKKVEIFSGLEDRALHELSNLFAEKNYKQGDIIFDEESMGNTMMIIYSGEVRVSQTPNPDTEEALIVLKKGDFFGEMAVLEDLPRSATTIAHTDANILEITREHFWKFIELDNNSGLKIVTKLARIISGRLREADKKLKAFTDLTKWI